MKLNELKIGMKVKGTSYIDKNRYTGNVVIIEGNVACILRDDGQEGGGELYNGNSTWKVRYNMSKECWGSDGNKGRLYKIFNNDKLKNLKKELLK